MIHSIVSVLSFLVLAVLFWPSAVAADEEHRSIPMRSMHHHWNVSVVDSSDGARLPCTLTVPLTKRGEPGLSGPDRVGLAGIRDDAAEIPGRSRDDPLSDGTAPDRSSIPFFALPAGGRPLVERTPRIGAYRAPVQPGPSPGSRRGARLGAHVGTLGVGAFAGWDAAHLLTVRGLVNTAGVGLDLDEDGTEFAVDLQLQSFGLVLDLHPFRNGFHLSGGAFTNGNQLSAMAEAGDIEIGDGRYDARVEALIDFEGVAPYFGLGWSSRRDRSGFSVGFEAGVLLQGEPLLSATGRIASAGEDCQFSVSREGRANICSEFDDTGLMNDLESEHREVRDDLEDIPFWPVLVLSLSYRFR